MKFFNIQKIDDSENYYYLYTVKKMTKKNFFFELKIIYLSIFSETYFSSMAKKTFD